MRGKKVEADGHHNNSIIKEYIEFGRERQLSWNMARGDRRRSRSSREKFGAQEGPRLRWLVLPADSGSDETKIDQRAAPRMSPRKVSRIQKKWLAKVGA